MRLRSYILCFILIAASSAMAIPGDFDGDGAVEVPDLAIFAADWLVSDPDIADPNTDMDASGTVNLADWALFTKTWLDGHINRAPVAADITTWCYAGESVDLTLDISDEQAGQLTYAWPTSPSKGVVTGTGATRTYHAWPDATSGNDVFSYQVNDGEFDSNVADVNVAVYRRDVDSVAFRNRQSGITIPSASVNVDDSFAVCFWIRTRWREGGLFQKRDADGGPGIVITLEDGVPVVRLYGAVGAAYTVSGWQPINDGQWHFVGFTYDAAATVAVMMYGDNEVSATIAADNFSNAADVQLGRTDDLLFYGQISTFSNYATAVIESFGIVLVKIEGREANAHAFSPAYHRRFLIDEGTGTTVNDVSDSYTGVVTNNNSSEWVPENTPLEGFPDWRSRVKAVDGRWMMSDFRRRQ